MLKLGGLSQNGEGWYKYICVYIYIYMRVLYIYMYVCEPVYIYVYRILAGVVSQCDDAARMK